MKTKVLYAGDTQVNHTTSIKGIDSWSFSYYLDSSTYLREALNDSNDIECHHMRASDAIEFLPSTVKGFKDFDCVILSDLGYNNINFQPGNVEPYKIPMGPDRVAALVDYVHQGGGFLMVGGWLSFSGVQGKAVYGGTRIENILPVTCEPRGVDDRMEITEGFSMDIDQPNHPIVQGLPWSNPYLLMGYNKVYLKKESALIASYRGDPIIATIRIDQGRSSVFTSDAGPHWGGSFLTWQGYKEFWQRLVKWTSGKL